MRFDKPPPVAAGEIIRPTARVYDGSFFFLDSPISPLLAIEEVIKIMEEKARQFIEALGGKENIVEIEGCITRLRGTLRDPSKVDMKKLQSLGVIGRPILMGKGIQVVVGTHAELIGTAMNKIMRAS